MNDIAIKAENIGKLYRIGEFVGYSTLRESLTNAVLSPFRALRHGEIKRSEKDSIWALKDVSFEIKQGEVVGLIGRNGAGKSTLLKVLARITEPTEGYIEARGRVSSLLEVGTGFHPELTGRENIYLNGAILGMRKKEIDSRFDEIVEFSGVEKFINTPLKRYSSGMQVRLAFAVAAHLEPDVLLVDEVLAVGDAEFQKKSLGKMQDIAGSGRTVLFVSHNMAAITSLCRSGILLDSGLLVMKGPTDKCVSYYLSKGLTENSAEKDTSGLERPTQHLGLGTALRITRVCLHTDNDKSVVKCGEPLMITMDFSCSEVLEDVTLGFAIETLGGIRVLDSASIESVSIPHLNPGKYSITGGYEENPLSPGYYNLVVGARCAKGGLDWLPEVMTFTVVDEQQYDSLWLEENNGIIRLPSKWSPLQDN